MNQKFTILSRVILNPKQVKNKVTVNCTFCEKEFQVWKSKYETAKKKFNGHLYCSRSCSRNNQPNLYDKFYWCDSCTSWIQHKEAKVKKNNIISFPMCPKLSCGNNRLRTKSWHNK